MKKVAIVTLGWREYTTKYFTTFMESVQLQDYDGEIKVFVTDNETSPETADYIRSEAPDAVLILNHTNDGYAKGMNDGIREAMRLGFDYIAVVNIHTQIERSYISELVKAVEADKNIGVAQGLLLLPDRETVLTLGNATHFLGFGYSTGYRMRFEEIGERENLVPSPSQGEGQGEVLLGGINYNDSKDATPPANTPSPPSREASDGHGRRGIHYPSGSSMFFRREVLERVGLMDEEYWMYNEDQEIGWRLLLAGYKNVLVPKAIMYCDYQHKRSMAKVYWMDRNRILSMLLCYKIWTLILILPAFIAMELGQLLFAWQSGWLKDKLKVYLYFLKPANWSYIAKARHRNQALRQASDKEICSLIVGEIKHQEFGGWKLRLANVVFGMYWGVARRLIFW